MANFTAKEAGDAWNAVVNQQKQLSGFPEPLGQQEKIKDRISIQTHSSGDPRYGDFWFNKNQLKQLVGGDYRLNDPTFDSENGFISHNEGSLDEAMKDGDWIITGENFYHVVPTDESTKKELVRASIRPQYDLPEGDFVVTIDKGRIKNIVGDQRGDWLADEQRTTPIEIVKNGDEIMVNGMVVDEKINKNRVELVLSGDNYIHLLKKGAGWELLNDAVYQARLAAGGKKKEAESVLTNWKEIPSKFIERAIKPRGWKDVVALGARAVADTGLPWSWAIGALIMGGNLGATAVKEWRTAREIGNFGDYWRQTALGRLYTGNTRTGLSEAERKTSLMLGASYGAVWLLLSEVVGTIIPGGGISRYFISRGLLGYAAPELFALIGKKDIEKSTGDKEKAKEWLELTLGAMSTTVTFGALLAFGTEGAVKAGIKFAEGRVAAHNAEAVPTPTHTAIPSPTAEATHTAVPLPSETQTPLPTVTVTVIPPTATHIQTQIPPTETNVPTITAEPPTAVHNLTEAASTSISPENWQPGTPIHIDLLGKAADLNLGWGIDTNHNNKVDFQLFWLGDGQGPDVIIRNTGQHFIRIGEKFFFDSNNDGIISAAEERRGGWNIEDFNPSLKEFGNLTPEEAKNLNLDASNVKDINNGDVFK